VKLPVDARYKALRDTFFGRFGGESIYFGVSDAALSSGNTHVAARILAGGVDYAPKNVALWTELGNAVALHDESNVSPAALLAYRQAMQVSPTHPGPPFFLALSYLRAGDLKQGRTWLARALALTPKNASYRDEIAVRLAVLDSIIKRQPPR
jgi:cytochrome c-type biogenesis protein CcmH/NrfG